MKAWRLFPFAVALAAAGVVATPAPAQQAVAQQLSILEERLNRLRADVEALQFNQQQIQHELRRIQGQMQDMSRSGPGVTLGDLQVLEARIRAVEEASQVRDKALAEQFAKELAALGAGRAPGAAASATTAEHVVEKGETLAVIARKYGVSVDAIAKANNLANPNEIKVGQKLTIPK